jgi:hypothetical protein
MNLPGRVWIYRRVRQHGPIDKIALLLKLRGPHWLVIHYHNGESDFLECDSVPKFLQWVNTPIFAPVPVHVIGPHGRLFAQWSARWTYREFMLSPLYKPIHKKLMSWTHTPSRGW